MMTLLRSLAIATVATVTAHASDLNIAHAWYGSLPHTDPAVALLGIPEVKEGHNLISLNRQRLTEFIQEASQRNSFNGIDKFPDGTPSRIEDPASEAGAQVRVQRSLNRGHQSLAVAYHTWTSRASAAAAIARPPATTFLFLEHDASITVERSGDLYYIFAVSL